VRPPGDPPRHLQFAEALAQVATVAAFALTVLAVNAGAVETNPATRWLATTYGWTITGVLAVATVHASFAVYRRVRHIAPRVVLVGAALVGAISVADVLVSLPVAFRVELLAGAGVGEFVPITVTAAVAVGCLARLPVRSVVERVGAVEVAARRYWSGVDRRALRRGALVVVLFALVLTPAIASVQFGGESMSPVNPSKAADTVIDAFEDGTFDGWSGDTAKVSITEEAWKGQYAIRTGTGSDNLRISKSVSESSPSSISFAFYYKNSGNTAHRITNNNANDMVSCDVGSGNLSCHNGVDVDTGINIPTNQWVIYEYQLNYESNTVDIQLYDSEGNELDSYSGLDMWNNGSDTSEFELLANGGDRWDQFVTGSITFSSSTSTPTPEPPEYDYTVEICYQGSATFDPLGARAIWHQVDVPDDPRDFAGGAVAERRTSYSTFSSDHKTTTTITAADDLTTRVDIETDRARFSLTGVNPSESNRFDFFAVSTPFAGETDAARNELASRACRERAPTPTGTAPPPGATPLPTASPVGTLDDDDGGPPTQTPYRERFELIGTCEIPTANGTKQGLSVEFWDPDYENEYLTFNLTYRGVHVDRTIEFDEPKGYYMGCHAAGDHAFVDPNNVGEPAWPDNTTVQFPNGTQTTYPNGTVGEFPDGSNVTTPPGENATTIAPPTFNGTAGTGNDTYSWNSTGFEAGLSAGFGGGGGGALIPPGSGSGAPLWLTVVPAGLVVGYAYLRRRNGGGGSGGNGGAGGSTGASGGPPAGRGGAP
jgi:hypothetical protein